MLLAPLVIVGAVTAHDTLMAPQVHRANVVLPGLDPDDAPIRVLLLADLHVAGPDMPPARVARIVTQANALQPDIVLFAGDFVSDKRTATAFYTYAEGLAPLAFLRPRFGSVAVLGNHDHWRNPTEARKILQRAGITVLANQALRTGPLTIGGLDDDFTGRADPDRTMAAMRHFGPPFVVLSHSPDPFPELSEDMSLTLAGHTHCGQIRYPWGGTPATMSRFGDRYACGRIVEDGRTLIVSAGLGTSVLPFRFGTKPDMWLITLRPEKKAGPRPKPEPRS